MKELTMGDLSIELFEISTLCDVAVGYAVGEGEQYDKNPQTAFDKLSYMLQLIQGRVAALEKAVDNANSNKQ